MPIKKSALHSHRFGINHKRQETFVSNQPELSQKQSHRERTVSDKQERKEFFEKLVRVGPKRPILMGKRTVVEKHYTDNTSEFIDFVTDVSFARGKYQLFVTAQWFNRSLVVLIWRQFFDRNLIFWPLDRFPNSVFMAASMLIRKYFFGPDIDVRRKNSTMMQVRQKCATFLNSMEWCRKMIGIFGYAFLPQHTITTNELTVAVHNVPRKHIQSSMVAFLNGSNGEFTGLDDVIEPKVRFLAKQVVDSMNYSIFSTLEELNRIDSIKDFSLIFLHFLFIVLSPTILYDEALTALVDVTEYGIEVILSKLSRVLFKYFKIDLVLNTRSLFFIKDVDMLELSHLKSIIMFAYENGVVLVSDVNVRMQIFLSRHVTHRKHSDSSVSWFLKLFKNNKRSITDLRGGMMQEVLNPLQANVQPALVNQAAQGINGQLGVIGDQRVQVQNGVVVANNPPAVNQRPHPNAGHDPAADFGVWYMLDKEKIISEFIHISKLEHRTLWTLDEIADHVPVLIDCMGSPFCGLTAIDVACGITPKVDNYCHMSRFKNDIFDSGKIDFLKKWAAFRGVNLRVTVPIINNNRVVDTKIFDYEASPLFEWVCLTLKNSNGSFYSDLDWNDVAHVGHYWLNVRIVGDIPNVGLPELGDGCFLQLVKLRFFKMLFIFMINFYFGILVSNWVLDIDSLWYFSGAIWIFGFLTLVYCFLRIFSWNVHYSVNPCFDERLGYFRNSSNKDVRSLRDRRDKFEHQDFYLRAVRVFRLHILNYQVYQTDSRVYIISIGRANQAIKECQLLPDGEEEKCLASVMRASVCNTNDSENGIYLDTIQYVKDWISCRNDRSGASYDKRTVAYSAGGLTAYIPNLDIVANNQFLGKRGGETNHVHRLFNPRERDFDRKVVAYCPDACLQTNKGPLGPGNLCISDSFSILSAFSGRSMSNDQESLDQGLLTEFVEFSKKFLEGYIDGTDVSDLVESEDPTEFFREMYKGKKTVSYIDSVLKTFSDWKSNLRVPVKFFQCGSFVKFEDSTKVNKGVARVRPRLIMTMSDYFLIMSCQFMKVVNAWCHGPFSKFQVKNLEPEEFIYIIEQASDKHHIVTDYSAFESSINGVVREVENYVFERLMVKAGFTHTLSIWRAMMEVFSNGKANFRSLYSKCGVFKIWSRCSGDFHTSAGNGIINVCVNAFACYKKLGYLPSDFRMIAEGDDGLIAPFYTDAGEILKMGFKFSSELEGFVAGDVDFLRRRWLMGTCFLNIGRSLKSTMWVKSQVPLGRSKQLAIWRAMGLSLHYMSPGHPVLFELVNRIGKLTSECSPFKGIERYFDSHKLINQPYDIFDFGSYPRDVKCNELMRQYIADGAQGFPPLSISIQLELEKRLRMDEVVYIGSLLDDYDDIKNADLCDQWLHNDRLKMSDEFKSVLTALRDSGVQAYMFDYLEC